MKDYLYTPSISWEAPSYCTNCQKELRERRSKMFDFLTGHKLLVRDCEYNGHNRWVRVPTDEGEYVWRRDI